MKTKKSPLKSTLKFRAPLAIALAFLIPVSCPAEPVTFFGIPLDFSEAPPSRPSRQVTSAEKTPSLLNDQKILILFDVSRSVLNKAKKSNFPMSRIKEEVVRLVDACPDGASIGIIQFTQNFKPYSENLVRLDDRNRASLRQWIEREWNETGTMPSGGNTRKNNRGILGVLEFSSGMKPDQIFLVSDASFQRRQEGAIVTIPWDDFESAVSSFPGTNPVLNFIGFQTEPKDRAEISAISRATGGKVAFIQ